MQQTLLAFVDKCCEHNHGDRNPNEKELTSVDANQHGWKIQQQSASQTTPRCTARKPNVAAHAEMMDCQH